MYDVMTEENTMTDTPQTDKSAVLEPIQEPVSTTSGDSRDVAKQSTDTTLSDVFHPTPHMLVWIDTAIQLMTDNITEVSDACSIQRSTWYNWLKDDKFRVWFKQEWDKRLAGDSWKLDAIGMKNAKRDHRYWQDMQRRVGNLVDKTQIAVANQMNVEFVDART